MGESIGIFELVKLIKNKWYVVLLLSLGGFGLAFGVSTYLIEPQFSASTNLLVSRPQTGDQRVELGEIQTNIQMITTYRDIIKDAVVLDKVSAELGGALTPEELSGKVSIITNSDSQIFSIEAIDSNPQRAALIANLVAATFKESLTEFMNVEDVAILSPAVPNNQSISPNILFNEGIGIFSGAVLGMAVILILALGDTRVHHEDFISNDLKWNRLGTVSSIQKFDSQTSNNSKMTERTDTPFVMERVKSNING